MRARAAALPRLQLTPRNVCDLELLAGRALSPPDRFIGRADYERVPEEMTPRAARAVDGTLLLHPTVGLTRPGGIDQHYTRVCSYKVLAERYYDPRRMLLALPPPPPFSEPQRRGERRVNSLDARRAGGSSRPRSCRTGRGVWAQTVKATLTVALTR